MNIDWLKNLRQASWRGVPFHVSSDNFTFGRNVVVHEFVYSKSPHVEDLGAKAKRFRVTAYIGLDVGNGFNLDSQRDAIIAACDTGGIGTLIHPFYGNLRGHVVDPTFEQATSYGSGMVSISFEFINSTDIDFAQSVFIDTGANLTSAASACYAQIADDFALTYSIENAQSFVQDDSLDMLNQFKSVIANKESFLIDAQISLSELSFNTILTQPNKLANNIINIIKQASNVDGYLTFIRQAIPSFETTSRARHRQNTQSFTHLIQSTAVVRLCELSGNLSGERYNAPSTYFNITPSLITQDDMNRVRLNVLDIATNEIYALSEAGIFENSASKITALRSATVAHLTSEGETLARTFITKCCDGNTYAARMPALVVAYRWHDQLNDDAIISRNDIAHPAFIPQNASLEILHDYA